MSLGDSYTSAPLVPIPTGNLIGCGRSTNNYPSDLARVIAPSSFTDASCGSATTDDRTQPQSVPFGGTNPPQFNSLAPANRLVTVGIGGYDAGLIGIATTCGETDLFQPFGACKNHYQSSGGDPNVARIDATGPKVAAVLQGIHQRAPRARVLIVGYLDGLAACKAPGVAGDAIVRRAAGRSGTGCRSGDRAGDRLGAVARSQTLVGGFEVLLDRPAA